MIILDKIFDDFVYKIMQLQVGLFVFVSNDFFYIFLCRKSAVEIVTGVCLRVCLEFGDKLQKLFTVQCSPQVAAFYILDQLLNGFDEDKNLENARQVLSLGGLTLLIKRIDDGEIHEKENSALIILTCVRAEGSCRSYLAENTN